MKKFITNNIYIFEMIHQANRKRGRILKKCFHGIKISCLTLNHFASVLLSRKSHPQHSGLLTSMTPIMAPHDSWDKGPAGPASSSATSTPYSYSLPSSFLSVPPQLPIPPPTAEPWHDSSVGNNSFHWFA